MVYGTMGIGVSEIGEALEKVKVGKVQWSNETGKHRATKHGSKSKGFDNWRENSKRKKKGERE